ncbi:MAG TPA: hypothetical protein VGP57_22975 [Actinoplanes sp.]|jgi:hypothetical protein|nr:hypothetical protein [Actinoplanes sp.]
MTRTRIALTLTTLGLAGILGLSGCGVGAGSSTAAVTAAAAADLSDEAYALQTVGFDTGLAADPAPSASASTAPDSQHKTRAERRAAMRKYLRKNTLHGEITVQGKDGVKTIVVQRGTVTAVTPTSVSVKSTDGFTATWTFGDKLKIVQNKKAVQASALKTGTEIGVAGTKNGSADTARLIAVK